MHASDGYVSCKYAREPEKTEVFRTFAGVELMYDIMNPDGFIIEVQVELRMRKKMI